MAALTLAAASPDAVGGASPPPALVASGVAARATAEGSQRKLLVDARGALMLAYVRPVRGVDQVFLGESADQGRTWRHTRVSAGALPARLPSLAASGDGALHVVWTDYAPTGRVWYRSRRGVAWSAPMILSPTGAYAGVPVVAVAGPRVHVLWYGIRPGAVPAPRRHGSLYEILATRLEGGRWTPPAVISPGRPDSINPSLAAGIGDAVHAAWYQFDGQVYQVRYARFDGGWLPPRTLTTGAAERTAVSLDAAGAQFHLVWVEQGAARVIVARSFVSGPLTLPGALGTPLSAPGVVADPVVSASGAWVVAAWRAGAGVVLRQIRPPGPPRSLGVGTAPAVAVGGSTAYVAWTTSTSTGADLVLLSVPLR